MTYKLNQFQIDAINNTAMLSWLTEPGGQPQVTIFGVKFDAPANADRAEIERAALKAARRDIEELLKHLP